MRANAAHANSWLIKPSEASYLDALIILSQGEATYFEGIAGSIG